MTHTRATGWRNWLLSAALLLTFGTGTHADLISLTASLDGAQETPPNDSPGTGSAAFILDDSNRTLGTAASFSGLTGTTTSADIEDSTGLIVHPFPTGVVGGFPTGVMQGSFTDIWTGLTAADVTLADEVLDRIDEIVAPGVNVNPSDGGWPNPALEKGARRR